MKISNEARARSKLLANDMVVDSFKPAVPPPGVVPAGAKMAMDDGVDGPYQWASRNALFDEGIGFLGYPYLAELSQRPEYRRISETIAKEMTRKWIKLQATGDSDVTEKIAFIEAEMKRLKVQDVFREALELDGFFGRSHIYLDTGDSENPEELKTPIGSGTGDLSGAKITPVKRLKRLAVIEPVWTYPNAYNASDPLREDYFAPQNWFVQGRLLHSSRLLTIVSRKVPDLLKPAYSFGGLSLSQMAKPYIDNWLRTRQSVSDLLFKFSTSVLKTNMADVLKGGAGADLFNRIELFTQYQSNSGVLALDMASEDFVNVAAPISGLDHLQAQSQEHMSAVSGIPLVKLLGITPSGLNASSDGEMRCFYDGIEAEQEATCTEPLTIIINFIQLSLFGEVDKDIGFKWEPLWTLDELGIANVRKTEMDTDIAAINAGVIMPIESRKRIAAEEDSPYASLDLDAVLPPPPGSEVPPGGPEDDPGSEGGSVQDPAMQNPAPAKAAAPAVVATVAPVAASPIAKTVPAVKPA